VERFHFCRSERIFHNEIAIVVEETGMAIGDFYMLKRGRRSEGGSVGHLIFSYRVEVGRDKHVNLPQPVGPET
jgi:hypothetical protein